MNSYTPKEGSAGQLTLALVRDLQRKLATKEHRIAELQEQLGSTKLSLIRTTDSRGNRVLITSAAVATVTEADASSQYHGTRSIIRLLDGRVIESRDGCRTIEEQMTTGGEG